MLTTLSAAPLASSATAPPLGPDATETGFRPQGIASSALSPEFWAAGAAIALLLVVLYFRIATKLVQDWYTIPDYSHGLLIPFFAAFLVWDNRRTLRATALRPSWNGLLLVAGGLFVLLAGVFGADLFLSRISFLILAAGLIWTLLGVPMLLRTRFLLFVILLSIPLPTILLNQITFPLQLFASHLAGMVLPLFGVPVLREGNIIQLPALALEVAEACSGIRSLVSLFTVAVIYGYFAERGILRRALFALAALPIAVGANVARIVGTGLCVQYWDPVKAMGFFHEFSGWLMFLLSLLCLYLVHLLVDRFVPAGSPSPGTLHPSGPPAA